MKAKIGGNDIWVLCNRDLKVNSYVGKMKGKIV